MIAPASSAVPATITEEARFGGWRSREAWWVFLLAAVPTLVKLLCYPSYPGSDDAFIHLTIVRNVTHGLGWGINPGEPINLSSSPLYTALVAQMNVNGLDALIAGEWLSALAGFGALVLLHRLLVVLGLRPASRLAGVAVAAFNLYLWRWNAVVMETTLGLFLLTLAYWCYHRADRPKAGDTVGRYFLAGIVVGAATLTRFELALALGCFGLRELVVYPRAVSRWLRTWVLLTAGFLVIVVPWFVYCRSYFHAMLPTTFYAKTSAGLLWWNPGVATSIFKLVASGDLIPLLGVGGLLAVAVWKRRAGGLWPSVTARLDVFLFPVLLALFYYLKTPGLQSAARYYLPGLHLLAAGLACACDALLKNLPTVAWLPALVSAVSAHAALAVGINQVTVAPILSRFKANYWSAAQSAAVVLKSRATPGRKVNVLVEVDIGMLSYYAGDGCYFFDGGALATPSLRDLTLAQQVERTRPDLVIETLGEKEGGMTEQVPALTPIWHRAFQSHSLTYPHAVYICTIYENKS